ncbi:hypothetical protein [Massilia aerilata]|uniref:Uncharacterized protein n=1 Tax=Massilia aerilata TaxID=453817 RepID=A0ABW0RTX1_9BURK
MIKITELLAAQFQLRRDPSEAEPQAGSQQAKGDGVAPVVHPYPSKALVLKNGQYTPSESDK